MYEGFNGFYERGIKMKEDWMIGNKENIEKVRKKLNKHVSYYGKRF